MNKTRLIIVDQSLTDMAGHHFEYDRSLSVAARSDGYDVTILANKSVSRGIGEQVKALPVFQLETWEWDARIKNYPKINYLLSNYQFLIDLEFPLRRQMTEVSSIVFAHMVTPRQILAWAYWLLFLRPFHEMSSVMLLLRYETELFNNPLGKMSFKLLEIAHKRRKFTLTTDSERLATKYMSICGIPIGVVPIPHTEAYAGANSISSSQGKRIRISCPGNARRDKGIIEVLQALEILNDSGLGSQVELCIQVNNVDRTLDKVMQDYRSKSIPNLFFLESELDSSLYVDTIMGSDMVLMPYWRNVYADRTSGVFTEALAAGKPVLVTRETWMSDQLKNHGAGILLDDQNPQHLAKAIETAISQVDELRENAESSKFAWIKRHNGDALWTKIKKLSEQHNCQHFEALS